MSGEQPEAPNQLLRIAVLSDLHAYDKRLDGEKSDPSFLCTDAPRDIPSQHPIAGLLSLIDEKQLKADVLLCPGDFGDKARPAGIDCGWRAVHEIGKALGVSLVAGTVGNHDMDSRYNQKDADPKGFLQSLSPAFPLPDEASNDKFWARNYTIYEGSSYRIVIVNSSAFHGGKTGELDHGRIAERTIERLKEEFSKLTPKPINILLCHHHPHKHSELQLGEYDEMQGGQHLLDMLGSGLYGEWIVVHGHKHHPKVRYAAGNQMAPVVFSAGSLSAKLYAELGTEARNQFYILTFPLDKLSQFGLVGRFNAWDWATGLGWKPARPGSGLPSRGGFGHHVKVNVLDSQIAAAIGQTTHAWDEIVTKFPELDYLVPDALTVLLSRLKQNFNLLVQHDSDGHPSQIGRA